MIPSLTAIDVYNIYFILRKIIGCLKDRHIFSSNHLTCLRTVSLLAIGIWLSKNIYSTVDVKHGHFFSKLLIFISNHICKYVTMNAKIVVSVFFRHKSTRENPVSVSTIVGVHLPGAFGATVDNSVP